MSAYNRKNSSIELLRIICIILIVAHHYCVHGISDALSYETINGYRVFLQLFGAFGKVACSIFALISGYYLVSYEIIGVGG